MKKMEIITRMNSITEEAEKIRSNPNPTDVRNFIDEVSEEINNLEHYRHDSATELYDYMDTAIRQYRIIRISMKKYI